MKQFIRNAVLVSFVCLYGVSAAYAAPTTHVSWAEILVANLSPDKNLYASNPTYIYWAGINGATSYENRTQCSSFVTRVLKQAYQWNDADFRTWFGSNSPSAANYHDAIVAQNGFSVIQKIGGIKAGDIIAVKYQSDPTSTGHAMIAKTTATKRAPTSPLIKGTFQYEIEVIDSSKSGHGTSDTRLMADKTWDTGAGTGTLRLYADNTGTITGYTWSTAKNSTYYGLKSNHHLAIGRLALP
jgi:hypothetical protein